MGGTAMPSADGGRFGKPGDCPALDRFPTGSYPAVMGSSDEDAPDRDQLVQQGLADAVAALPRAEQAQPLIALDRSIHSKEPAAPKLSCMPFSRYHAKVSTNRVHLVDRDAAPAAVIWTGMQALEIGVG